MGAVAAAADGNDTYRSQLSSLWAASASGDPQVVLAQLATPTSMNLSDALYQLPHAAVERLDAYGDAYLDLLADLDALVATDQAFLLGSVLGSAPSGNMPSQRPSSSHRAKVLWCGSTSLRCAFVAVDILRWSAALRDQVVVTGCPPALAALEGERTREVVAPSALAALKVATSAMNDLIMNLY